MIWVTLIILSIGQILIKLGLGNGGIPVGKTPAHTLLNILRTMFTPKIAAGFFLYIIGTMIWLTVLSKVPLSIAFPLFSMSYFLVVIMSATVLKEKVVWKYAVIGLVLISFGVSCIGLSSPPKQHSASTASVEGRR